MKKLITLAACAALAACSQAEAPAEEEAAVEAPAEESMAGTYDATWADGTVRTTTIDADGNFVNMEGDTEIGRGTVAAVNGQTCFNSAEEGSAPVCYTDSEPAEDGSWVATADDGTEVTVMKRAEEAAAEEAAE